MLASDSVYLLMFGSGLLGGLGHCSGMCGPIVATYSLNLRPAPYTAPGQAYFPHLFYNIGRITTYSIIGGIMGLTGSFADIVQSIGKFQNITMAAIGALMIVMGFTSSGWFSSRGRGDTASGRHSMTVLLSSAVNRMISFSAETHTSGSFYAVGMATGFIPCGLLYTAYIAAAGAGAGANSQIEGFLKGMLMLFLFGVGTTPALFLIGRITAVKSAWVRKRFYAVSSLFMIMIGALLIYRSFSY